jgi:hypothetical protein
MLNSVKILGEDNRSTRGGGGGVERGHCNNRATNRGGFDFFSVFSTLWKDVPDDWEILCLGFSDRVHKSLSSTLTGHPPPPPLVLLK